MLEINKEDFDFELLDYPLDKKETKDKKIEQLTIKSNFILYENYLTDFVSKDLDLDEDGKILKSEGVDEKKTSSLNN